MFGDPDTQDSKNIFNLFTSNPFVRRVANGRRNYVPETQKMKKNDESSLYDRKKLGRSGRGREGEIRLRSLRRQINYFSSTRVQTG